MTYAYFYLCCAALVVNLCLFIGAYKNRHRRLAKEFMALVALHFVALFFFTLSLLDGELEQKYALHEMKFLGTSFFTVAVYALYLPFMGRQAFVKKRYLAILSVVPVINILAVFTNGSHNLFRRTVWLAERPFGSFVMPSSGILFWVFVAYSYAVVLFILMLFIHSIFSTPKIYRDRMRLMFWSIVFTIAVNILSVTSVFFVDYGDVTLIAFTYTLVVQYYALLVYKPRRMIMMSRSRAVNEIKNPIIIYDYQGGFMDANVTAYDALKHVAAMRLTDFEAQTEKVFDGKTYGISAEKMYDDENFFAGTVVLLNDITKIKNQEAMLKRIVGHDHMTGLDNLHAFRAQLNCFTENDLPVAFVLFDICSMREINRDFGAIYGDEIIQDLAGLILKRLPADALCARLDGDEFGVALPNTTRNAARLFIEKVLKDIREADINVDYGLAVQSDAMIDIGQLFKTAEDNLAGNKMGLGLKRK